MTLQQLKCFLAMAEVLHYTKAANQLYISQPSLSYAISELEKELGVPFFERQGNHTLITKYGESFLPYVKQIFSTLNEAKAHLYEMLDASTGKVNLGYIYSISFDYVPRMLELFYADQGNSQITFEFFQGLHYTLIEKLKSGSVDLLLSANPDDRTIEGVPVYKQELFVIVPEGHRLADKEVVSLNDVKGEPLISLSKTSDIRNHLVKCFEKIGAKPLIAGEVAECIGMSALVRANLGIAITPLSPTFEGGKLKVLRFREEERETMHRDIHLLWMKDHQLEPSVKRFRDFIIDQSNRL
ncbi:LysR family transcriptional regulator [uncultured Propionivibrio sp.]|uniref:LysR family transcriptional regulator n=1 Tax=uncultured Propionivibrio sp. TaxID=426737 RepID=UPI0029C05F23|nr:LysR family transcriptional regulator [uncultured Propionivibrio sp.]